MVIFNSYVKLPEGMLNPHEKSSIFIVIPPNFRRVEAEKGSFRPLAAPGGDQPRSVEEGDVFAQQALWPGATGAGKWPHVIHSKKCI